MKLLQTCLVLLASGMGSALPTSYDAAGAQLDQLDTRSINEPNQALQILDRRFNPRTCRVIGKTLLTIGTSQAK